MREIIGG